MALTDDLVAWYDFNSSGGASNVKDQHRDDAGGGQNLTDYNSVGRIGESKTGISTGQAALFNASNLEYFKSTDSDLFQPTTCTHGAVFKCDAVETTAERGRVNICGSAEFEGVSLLITAAGGGDFDLVASGPGGSQKNSNVTVSDISDAYIWFAFAEWDQSGVITLYYRKKGASSWSLATKSGAATSFGSPTKYMIGTTTFEDQYGIYDGWIDSVGYWTRALSSSERDEYYNNGNGIEYGDINSPPSASLSLSQV